jgi:23S rRNA (uridine2552-2'-O)-methyltransferase
MSKSKHRKSSQSWLDEHHSDFYVASSKISGYRSRSSYKLLELQNKDKLFNPGMSVVDLGSSPGGWSQVLTKFVGKSGQVFALDYLRMNPISGVNFIQGDFTKTTTYEKICAMIHGKHIDWVISDMSPNISGNKTIDQSKTISLAELVSEFAEHNLRRNGNLLVKVFQGEGLDKFTNLLKQRYQRIIIRKPKASRSRSSELYVIAFSKRNH